MYNRILEGDSWGVLVGCLDAFVLPAMDVVNG